MNVPPDPPATGLLPSLNPFDWLLLLLLAYSTLRALLRGLILELVSLCGLIAGLLLASWNYSALSHWLRAWLTNRVFADLVAFLGIVVGVSILASLLGRLLRRSAAAVGLGPLDRLLGALFGFLRGCLAAAAMILPVAAFLPASSAPAQWIAESRFSPYILSAAHAVSFVVPRDLEQRIRGGTSRLKHTEPGWIKPPR